MVMKLFPIFAIVPKWGEEKSTIKLKKNVTKFCKKESLETKKTPVGSMPIALLAGSMLV